MEKLLNFKKNITHQFTSSINDIQYKHNMISHYKSSDWYDYKKVINEEE